MHAPFRTRRLLALALGLTAAVAPVRAQDPDRRAADLLARMTREEKFWQLFMIPGDLDSASFDYSRGIFGLQIGAVSGIAPRDAARAHAARVDSIQRWFARTRLAIPIIPFDEALHGLMREGATVFPQAIGLAATWDSALVGRVHLAAARETRSRGIRMVLSPVVNLATDVRWGRVEETYGEDVHLTSVMGRQYVRAFEGMGVITTPKHFVTNVGEGGRDSYPIDASRRALEEKHFVPFRSLLQRTGARSVMTAYNSVDGSPATQSGFLMNEVLKGAWGFPGFIISDAAATGGATVLHRTEASTATATQHAFRSGLDVVFQSTWPQHRPYWRAFEQGLVPDSIIDASVLRVLRQKFALGLFDDPRIFPDSAAYWAGHAAHRVLARESARASLVLLRNAPFARQGAAAPSGGAARAVDTLAPRTLPFAQGVSRVAVIGPDADTVRLGGYSGPGIAPVSILDAIRARVGVQGTVRFARGATRLAPTHRVVPAGQLEWHGGDAMGRGLRGEYWPNNRFEGAPRITRIDETVDFGWTLGSPGPGIPYDWYSVRWSGTIVAPASGLTRLGVEGNDGYRLWLDGRLIIDAWEKRSYGARLVPVTLAPGSRHEIRLDYFESTGNARVKLVWDAGVPRDHDARIAAAVSAARASEVAVVVVGIEEGEFRDRASLALPGHQEALIRAVAATGVPTTVVIIGGSAVTMTRWLDDVGAVIMAWYPGEEGGPAIASLLFGDADPSGRLPLTFPLAEGQLPLTYDHKPTGRGDDYVDLSGQPLFPFGHGLTYTRFAYEELRIEVERGRPAPRVRVSARIRNTGARAGDEVVQLYLRDVLTSVAQPLTALKGFTRIALQPGEARDVEFVLDAEHLQLLDEQMRWVVEPGLFRVMVGASSKDIRLRGEFTLP